MSEFSLRKWFSDHYSAKVWKKLCLVVQYESEDGSLEESDEMYLSKVAITKLASGLNLTHETRARVEILAFEWSDDVEAQAQVADALLLVLVELALSFPNLQSLTISRFGLTDVGPLARLTNLNSLYLDSNRIVNLAPLEHLAKLVALSLAHNQIRDVTPLAALPLLADLHLVDNPLGDITSLKDLKHFKYDSSVGGSNGSEKVDVKQRDKSPEREIDEVAEAVKTTTPQDRVRRYAKRQERK